MTQQEINGTKDMLKAMANTQDTYFMCFSGMDEEFVRQMCAMQQQENQKKRETQMSMAKIGLFGTLIAGGVAIATGILKHNDTKALTSSIDALNATLTATKGVSDITSEIVQVK